MDLNAVNRAEIRRYLGISGNRSPDDATEALIEDCLRELNEKITPGHVFRTFPLERSPGDASDETLHFADMTVRSHDLSRNLTGCEEVLLFAATIGEGADFLIRRYEKTRMSRAIVMQAAAAAMIEAYCNEINDAWKEEYRAKGESLRPRYSCGYGDFALEYQKEFLRALEMEKRLGVRLTEGCLMVPTKTVTAVIGIAQDGV